MPKFSSAMSSSGSSERHSSSTDDSTQETDSENIEIELKQNMPSIFEIATLTNQIPYITDHIEFLEKLQNSFTLCSGDLTLGCCGFVSYTEVKGCIAKKTKKIINSMLSCVESDSSVALFFCPRFVNVPLNEVLEMYKKSYNSGCNFQYFIAISRVYTLNKEELEESTKIFTEFSNDDLKNFPYRSEEVFLLKSKLKQNTEIEGTLFKVIVADRQEFEYFLDSFEKELENNQ